jgi:hypothetical protein
MGGVIMIVIYNAAFVLLFAALVLLWSRRNFRSRYKPRDKFIADEREANSARKREVEPEFFYTPDVSMLPFDERAEGQIAKRQEKVSVCAAKTMLRFPKKLSNLELKKAYGLANLERITFYEENYGAYVSALAAWAEALLDADADNPDAARILEHTVELGSEFRKTYTLLADYYARRGDASALERLGDAADAAFEDGVIKRQLINRITRTLDEVDA